MWVWRSALMGFLFYTTPVLFFLHGLTDYYQDYIWTYWGDEPSNVYDFIVVGAGSAGATVALRLSKNNRVLLLEAGGHPYRLQNVPALAPDMLNHPQWDWMYRTVPQKHAGFALYDNVSFWSRGKVLGGSSTLNYMFYLRGHPHDYDNWAKITNDKEWSYENVLPYFKKSIKSYKGEYQKNSKHYGESPYGFLNVEQLRWTRLRKEFINAGKEFGYDEIDANGPQTEGFGSIEVTQQNGERFGTYAAIIRNLLERKSVTVAIYSQATKIKLDKSGKAVGVYYYRHNVQKYATATKEIIVSGGSINSPKLLMNSGIGPKEHLESIGIKSKVDLPVGKNLEDHLMTSIMPFTMEKAGMSYSPDKEFGPGALYDFAMERQGPLTAAGAVTAQAFLCSENLLSQNSTECKWPDLQIYLSSISMFKMFGRMVSRAVNMRMDFLEGAFDPFLGEESFIIMLSLVRPNSKGEITLKDKNPLSYPIIDPKYFEDPKDLQILLKGVKFVVKLIEGSKVFQEMGAKFSNIPVPGCEQFTVKTDEYFECYLKNFIVTIWHPTGTCKMGRGTSDKTAVVDSKLRVLNVRSLRVADASIMPVIVNANTNAPAIMIGEKAAAFIQQYWADQYQVTDLFHSYFKPLNDHKCFYSRFS